MNTDLEVKAERAAKLVADAASLAAIRIADAAKSASDSAASAAQAQAAAAQVLGAVAVARLDSLDKKFDSHEDLDRDRFAAFNDSQKDVRDELKEDIKDVANDVKDLNVDLKKQTKVITLITGGLIAISKVPDIVSFIHHATN